MYIGLDLSSTSTGIALVALNGESIGAKVIRPKKLREAKRLAYIRDTIKEMAEPGLSSDSKACVEGYAYNENFNREIMGELGGVVRVLLYDLGVDYYVVPPATLKKFVTGSGRAEKAEIMMAVYKKWHEEMRHNDEADAFGLAKFAEAIAHPSRCKYEYERTIIKNYRQKYLEKS